MLCAPIHSAIGVIQHNIIEQETDLKPALIALPTLHVTLMVMHLATDDEIARASDALTACKDRLELLATEPLVLTSCGIDNFRNQVVFAKLNNDAGAHNLRKIAETTCEVFKEYGISSSDDKGFKPHMTILKLSKLSNKQKAKGTKKVSPHLYKRYSECVFGAQTVRSVQLCSMLKRKDQFGYYHVEQKLDLVADDYNEMEMECCELSSTGEKHVCTRTPPPAEHFKDQFEAELTWTFNDNSP